MFGTFRKVAGAGKPKYEIWMGEERLLGAAKAKISKAGTVELIDANDDFLSVKIRRTDNAVAWVSSLPGRWWVARGTSALWFALSDFRMFAESLPKLPNRFADELLTFGADEAQTLLRASIMTAPSFRPAIVPPKSWADLETLRQYSLADPPNASVAEKLEEIAAAIPAMTISLRDVAADAPSAACSLVESYTFEGAETQQTKRLVVTDAGDAWHWVGGGCWGRITPG